MSWAKSIPFNRLFKNIVENATIQFRSHDERNWPSFLYPPGSEYNVNELDKGLFRGPIIIWVCSFLSHPVAFCQTIYLDLAIDIYGQRFGLHWLSICSQMFSSRNAWYARGFSRGRCLRCCSGELTEAQPIWHTYISKGFSGLLRAMFSRWLGHRGSFFQAGCFLRQVCWPVRRGSQWPMGHWYSSVLN